MKIQSLSVVVPTMRCINDCKFCVSKMGNNEYKNQLDGNKTFYDLYQKQYLQRLEFARDNGCNTVMLTGDAEPQQNRDFLKTFGTLNSMLERPFRWIEMQTTGTLLDDGYLRFLRNHVGVSTISVSTSSFDDEENAKIIGMKNKINLSFLCSEIKRYDFNLRLSLNMTNAFSGMSVKEIMLKGKDLGADQLTFRGMYTSGNNTPQDKWLEEHQYGSLEPIKEYIQTNGRELETLEFGAVKYDVHGMGVVLDDDCMATKSKEALKYLILRPDCKLYSKWDTKASLIF